MPYLKLKKEDYMTIEPIINARFKKFCESYGFSEAKENVAFERFVNHSILTAHQPDAFGADSELLNFVCVGGTDDTGIDGIGIKVNGLLVKDSQEIEDVANKFKRINVEFIFIQSKMQTNFDSGDFIKFTAGVRDFLSEKQLQPRNENINNALMIKNYLLDDDIVVMWDNNPSVRIYYVAMGKWCDSPHLNAHAEQFKKDLSQLSAYSTCNVHFIDASNLKSICDNNENSFSSTIEVVEAMPLTEVKDVNNACVALCYANELINLLSTDQGMIRKSLFEDNVRDYQGNNSVNEDILHTLEKEPEKFGLLNNGITIVCDEYKQNNRRITLKNPQIVNGCQTSHVLFLANKNGISIEKVPLQIKIISTENTDTINQIVRGTNRQSIVLDEAFETTKPFHKNLEEFFQAISTDYKKIYYERRSKQFQHDPRIKPIEKVNLKNMIQYILSVFFNLPHVSHRHEAKLLQEFGDRVFQDHQSKLPYYTVSLLLVETERLARSGLFNNKKIESFKPQILMIFREILCGPKISIDKEKKIDAYCQIILHCIMDERYFSETLTKAIVLFEKATDYWINILKRSPDGRKDVPEFTNLLLSMCRSGTEETTQMLSTDLDSDNDKHFGKVVKIIFDRHGDKCGFIHHINGDIFFHSNSNSSLNFDYLLNKTVSYNVIVNNKDDREQAIDVEMLENL